MTEPASYTAKDLARAFSGAFTPSANGCLEWTRYRNRDGYGIVNYGRKSHLAHRAFYQMMIGPIPAGATLDHLCRNRCCINPAHLEPVSPVENVMRGEGFAARNARKTHCVHGHPFSAENTYWEGRKRHCQTCKTLTNRRHSAARSAARKEAQA